MSEPSVRARLPAMEFHPIFYLYSILQWILDKLFSPTPPPPHARLHRPRIAIIGAGLTGVSSASHCVGHGFDVTIFEADDEKSLGGIWTVSLLPMMQLDVTNPSLESQQHLRPPDSQYHVSLPPLRQVELRLPRSSTNRLPNYSIVETLRSTRTHKVQYQGHVGETG